MAHLEIISYYCVSCRPCKELGGLIGSCQAEHGASGINGLEEHLGSYSDPEVEAPWIESRGLRFPAILGDFRFEELGTSQWLLVNNACFFW